MMRHPILLMSVAALVLVAGCRGSDGPMEPALVPDVPLFSIYGYDCQMDPHKCQILQDGINYLLHHANPDCVFFGISAQHRFDADAGVAGFRETAQLDPDADMSVFDPTDGYTNVYPSFWDNPYIDQSSATGGIIAHEEEHQYGGSESDAQQVQDMCLNPQA